MPTDTEQELDKQIETAIQKVENTRVNHPSHYNQGEIEVIDYIEDQNLGFCLGNAVKYISRAGYKQDYQIQDQKEKTIEDINKAIWYLERRIKEIEGDLCS